MLIIISDLLLWFGCVYLLVSGWVCIGYLYVVVVFGVELFGRIRFDVRVRRERVEFGNSR